MIFSRSLTETISIEKPKNRKNNPETWYVNENFLIILMNIDEKVIKCRIQWSYFREHPIFRFLFQPIIS